MKPKVQPLHEAIPSFLKEEAVFALSVALAGVAAAVVASRLENNITRRSVQGFGGLVTSWGAVMLGAVAAETVHFMGDDPTRQHVVGDVMDNVFNRIIP